MTEKYSAEFKAKFFTDPDLFEEQPIRDRKREIDLLTEDGKVEFIKDFISLANSSIIFADSSQLLIGITDDGELIGIEPTLSPLRKQAGISDITFKDWEELKKRISNLIKNFIEPLPPWDLLHGEVEGKNVAYIEITQQFGDFYCVMKDLKGKRRSISMGETWVRFGESKQLIDIHNLNQLLPRLGYCKDIPFIKTSSWLKYSREQLVEIKSDEFSHNPISLTTDKGLSAEKSIDEFIRGSSRILIIEGMAGSGKSELLQRYTLQWLEEIGNQAEKALRYQFFWGPDFYIPLFIRFRDIPGRNRKPLQDFLVSYANKNNTFWSKKCNDPLTLFRVPGIKWLVILDGLDEIDDARVRDELIREIRNLIIDFPVMKIIISTRPGIPLQNAFTSQVEKIYINSISDQQLEAAIESCTVDDALAILHAINDDPDVKELCLRPIFLRALIEAFVKPDNQLVGIKKAEEPDNSVEDVPVEGTGSIPFIKENELDIFTSGTTSSATGDGVDHKEDNYFKPDRGSYSIDPIEIATQLLNRFIQREIDRRMIPSDKAAELTNKLGCLAIRTDGQMPVFGFDLLSRLGAKTQSWAFNTGIVNCITTNNQLVKFINETTKAYFAAKVIEPSLVRNNDKKFVKTMMNFENQFRDKVLIILECITTYEIPRLQ